MAPRSQPIRPELPPKFCASASSQLWVNPAASRPPQLQPVKPKIRPSILITASEWCQCPTLTLLISASRDRYRGQPGTAATDTTLCGFDQRLAKARIHRFCEHPGAAVAHSHPPPDCGDRAEFPGGFEKRGQSKSKSRAICEFAALTDHSLNRPFGPITAPPRRSAEAPASPSGCVRFPPGATGCGAPSPS
jgi:hypothetical protein